ncbi:MAG: DUF1015 domain-containing protein [Deltaproteobacteria bacterium]|nr:DUF1015 domain-containing protein [Deltaproteobacteria bacterium]MCB9785739.1 DUF1015 domain-containing protein [Deltaproteobacteria bacterium]
MRLHPFCALHPRPDLAAEVASPPYDVVDAAEARALVLGRPDSFLRVVRSEVGLPQDTDPYAPEVYAAAAERLRAMIADEVLVRDPSPAIWVYRLDWGLQTQIGFVGCVEVDDYLSGRVKRHEHTRRDKEDDRTRHIDTVGAHTGPVFLTCRAQPSLSALQSRLTADAPTLEVTARSVRHRLWRVADPELLGVLERAMAQLDAFYIADGHHRAASAARARDLRRAAHPTAPADAGFERFLAVVFPADQLRILPYNRVVADLNGLSEDAFLERIDGPFEVSPPGSPAAPVSRHEMALYLGGKWRMLRARRHLIDEDDPIARLDVAILQDHLLAPVLGISDPRSDKRIDFVGGIRGTDELSRRVDAQGGGCAFSMTATSIEELLAVADAGLVMPPKSTWFEPKLASGLLVHPLD